jgi:membrane-bound serine protease (ClpP class)
MRIHLLTALAVSIPFGLLTIFLVNIAVRARRGKVVTGKRGLIGEVGVARTQLRPEGKIFVRGELWNATCSTGVEQGQSVRISGVNNLVLTVEPVETGAPVGSHQQ